VSAFRHLLAGMQRDQDERRERERERRKYGPGPVHARARARRWPNAISDRSALQRLATDDPAALSSRLADKEELVCHLSPPKCTIHPPVRRFTVTRPLPTSRCGAKLNARAAGLPLGAEEGNPSFLREQVKKPPAYTHMHARAGMPATLCPSTLLPLFPPFYPALFPAPLSFTRPSSRISTSLRERKPP